MSYQVLARKLRPPDFDALVGQDHVVRALRHALDNDRLHHAYLFTGTRGVGKTTIARLLAKCLNCEAGVSSSPCGVCSACQEISENRFVDLIEVDAASRTGVGDTRELLENAQYLPTRGRFKVYLIDEVHMLSTPAFNALLKTLEEPPEHVKFLLATTDPKKVPVTVLSRCLQFNLKRLPVEQIEGQFRHILEAEQVASEPAALGVLARAADGSMRDGLSLLDQAIAFGGGTVNSAEVRAMLGVVATERLPEMVSAAQRGEAAAVMAEIEAISEHAPDFAGLLREVVTLLHRTAVLQQVPAAAQPSWGDIERLGGLAAQIPPEELQLFYQIALTGQRDLPLAPDERSGFEMVMLRMLAFRPDTGEEIGTGGRGIAEGPAAPPGDGRSRKMADGSAPAAEQQSTTAPEQPVSNVPGPASTSAGDTGFSDWHAFVGRLGLKGMAAQLADNCVFENWNGKQLSLRVDPVCSGLIGSLAEQRLQEALSAAAGQPVAVKLSAEASEEETPAQREAREARARQEATEADISADPLVLGMQETFDAEIVPDSIRRIE